MVSSPGKGLHFAATAGLAIITVTLVAVLLRVRRVARPYMTQESVSTIYQISPNLSLRFYYLTELTRPPAGERKLTDCVPCPCTSMDVHSNIEREKPATFAAIRLELDEGGDGVPVLAALLPVCSLESVSVMRQESSIPPGVAPVFIRIDMAIYSFRQIEEQWQLLCYAEDCSIFMLREKPKLVGLIADREWSPLGDPHFGKAIRNWLDNGQDITTLKKPTGP